jgi:formate hydrogenlyase subunit 6/NADH:ubiquinone oxidoreductase subunit I
MKIGSMFSDVFGSFFKKPITEKYPFEKKPAPENLRGKLIYSPEKCTGCQLCVKDCPADALELLVVDKVNKRFVMKYHADRCTFCAQCLESCRMNCLVMSNTEWEMAALNKEAFRVYYGRDEDVAFILAKAHGSDADASLEG